MLEQLKEIRSKLDAVIASLDTAQPAPVYVKQPLPEGVETPYTACRALWNAAANAGLFNLADYIPGLQQFGAYRKPPKTAEEMNADIIKLGFSAWGQEWLAEDKNLAMIHPAYARHFVGYTAKRKHQNDESQGYIRLP